MGQGWTRLRLVMVRILCHPTQYSWITEHMKDSTGILWIPPPGISFEHSRRLAFCKWSKPQIPFQYFSISGAIITTPVINIWRHPLFWKDKFHSEAIFIILFYLFQYVREQVLQDCLYKENCLLLLPAGQHNRSYHAARKKNCIIFFFLAEKIYIEIGDSWICIALNTDI